ncbi:hypothetical protein, partial [Nitrospira sp. BLG_2]|uniref:hypothetical protein n=1 Tax=Nitrospira sp. BLG_2 TaxID=3397507 RepID=UPI003B9CA622
SRIDSLGIAERISNVNLHSADLPDLNIPNVNIPSALVTSVSSFELPKIPELSFNDFSAIDLSPDLSEINNELLFNTPEGLTGIQENLTGLKEKFSVLDQLKSNPDKAIEQAFGNLDGINELKNLKNPIDQIPANNPDAVREKLKEQAINHFTGKEELLSKSMEQVSKYKQKYSSVQSIKDIPKKVPNEMKDKPLTERLIPGVSFQYQFKNNYLLDIYGYAGYKLTSRITTGIGWNQRVARGQDNSYWNHNASIYGPRVFGNYSLGKGFIAHFELEVMNTFVSYNRTDPTIGQREWVWSTMTGLKKEYRITKNLKGTILVLYNIIDPRHKSPYNDRLNTRIGFEYRIKKKPKEKVQN